MFFRYACPACEGDLKSCPPATKKVPWYKLVTRHTLLCPHCGVEIEKRFAGFDSVMFAALATLLGGGGFVSIWRLGRFIVPAVLLLLGLRMLAGVIYPVYARVKSRR